MGFSPPTKSRRQKREEKEKEEEKEKQHTKKITEGKISFKDVDFAYPSRSDVEVLKQLSFEIESGQQVALVGPSGAGKSTITSLILKFFEVSKGEIQIDDKAITDYALADLRAAMAIVPQDVVLFGGSIYDNILYGNPEASKNEVKDKWIDLKTRKFLS